MKIEIVLTRYEYKEKYECFSPKNSIKSYSLSEENTKRILNFMQETHDKNSIIKVGKNYYKESFVSIMTDLNIINVFIYVFDSEEVEKHKNAFNKISETKIFIH